MRLLVLLFMLQSKAKSLTLSDILGFGVGLFQDFDFCDSDFRGKVWFLVFGNILDFGIGVILGFAFCGLGFSQ
jgi:hypothetical protein